MPQFPRRNTQPMRPESYRRIARLLREIADALDASAEAQDRFQRQALTMRLHGLYKSAHAWWHRHRSTVDGSLHIPQRDNHG